MFVECFAMEPAAWTECDEAYKAFEDWCRANGEFGLLHSVKKNWFTVRLRSIPGLEKLPNDAPKKNGMRVYFGFRSVAEPSVFRPRAI
jgi:hypothetical protein